MKNKKVNVVFVSLLFVALAFTFSGCSLLNINLQQPDYSAQEKVVKDFYKYTNDCDIEGMLSVCDTNSKNMINGSSYLLQLLLDSTGQNNVNVRDFCMSLFPSLKSFLGKNNVTFNVNPTSIEFSDIDNTHCSATVMVHYDVVDNGKSNPFDSRDELNLVKEGNDWKIDISKEMQDAASLGLDFGLGLFGF